MPWWAWVVIAFAVALKIFDMVLFEIIPAVKERRFWARIYSNGAFRKNAEGTEDMREPFDEFTEKNFKAVEE